MDVKNILSKCDHTLLGQTATWSDIQKICDEGTMYATASVCIPPSYVKQAKEYVGEKLKICTVIGFPNGYNTTAVKVYETKDAIANGADEIDMVINIGKLKDGLDDEVCEEIRQIKGACGDKILKVIIETCLLTEDEKVRMCHIVTKAGADYITVHYEACKENLREVLELIRSTGAKCGAVINPDTPVEKIADVIPLCDMVLVMSVFPGFGGQKFIPESLDKLRTLRKLIDESGKQILLEIDGGVNAENVEEIKAAGADVIVAGNAVFKASDRAAMIAKLKA